MGFLWIPQIRDTHPFNLRESGRVFNIHFYLDLSVAIFKLKLKKIMCFSNVAVSTNRIDLDTIAGRSARFTVLAQLSRRS